jgi:ubiquinone biosynthesis protein
VKWLRLFLRLLRIQSVLLAYGLDEEVKLPWLRPVRWLRRGFSKDFRPGSRAQRLRQALEELGPIYVKFGQALSTRPDLLPEDIALELVKLQDRVPPFPGEEAVALIEAEFNAKVSEIFAEFDLTPLASASVAQVHAARLHSGEEVVVKVLRPNIHAKLRQDLELLAALARLVSFWPAAKRFRPVEVIAEFEKTLLDELDLMREAANCQELRRHFEDSELLYVPKVYWDFTRPAVLVLERLRGIPISDRKALEAAGVDLKLLAERGVEIFFTQVFRDNFFHADMHPGNIFVDPARTRYLAVDFGIVASLSEDDQYYLAVNLLAFFNRDYRKVAQMHVESGWVPPDTRVDEFAAAIRAACEPIFAKPLGEISYGRLLLYLFKTARRFRMEVQPQLVLLQKTLLQIEGLGRQLYPELDLWQTAKPFLEDWFNRRLHPKTLLQRALDQLPTLAEQLPEVPTWVLRLLDQAQQGKLKVQWQAQELAELKAQLAANQRRTIAAIVGSALLISASLLLGQGILTPWTLGMAGLGGVWISRAWWRGGRLP